MTYTLTAADYVYLDRVTNQYNAVKQLIASLPDTMGLREFSDRYDKRRPGIPGTAKSLNQRVQTLIEIGQFDIAARLIATKVRTAYRLERTP
jgi:hypothetical protein